MCLNPYVIDNPYRGLENIGYNYLHDCRSLKLLVPCGHCPVCISLKQQYFAQRCICETFDNYLFFVTLTYRTSFLPILKVNNYKFYYADFRHIQNMFKRIRKYNLFGSSFRYWCVSEYGSLNHRPHFHLIISFPKSEHDDKWKPFNIERKLHDVLLSQWVTNVGSNRKPIYKELCKYVVTSKGRTFDCHYVQPYCTIEGESDVAFYVSKYLLKYSKYVENLHSALKLNLEPSEFKKVWSKLQPRCVCSKNWGNTKSVKTKNHIRKGIDISLSDSQLLYPIFINPHNGKEYPLAPYYKKKFFTLADAHSFFYKMSEDNSEFYHDQAVSDVQNIHDKYLQFYNNLDLLSMREESESSYFDLNDESTF